MFFFNSNNSLESNFPNKIGRVVSTLILLINFPFDPIRNSLLFFTLAINFVGFICILIVFDNFF